MDLPFATAEDVAKRLGKESASDFTAAQTAQVTVLLDLASEGILDALDKSEAWASGQSYTPLALRGVCVEAVARVMLNPGAVRSKSEQLGQHTHAESYRDGMGSLELTDYEQRRVRRAVFGSNAGSARADTLADKIIDEGLLDRYASLGGTDEAS